MAVEASGSNSQNRAIPIDGIPLNNAKDNFNYSISAVLIVSGVTTFVLVVLTSLTTAGVLPNSIALISVSASGSVVSAIVFAICLIQKCRASHKEKLRKEGELRYERQQKIIADMNSEYELGEIKKQLNEELTNPEARHAAAERRAQYLKNAFEKFGKKDKED